METNEREALENWMKVVTLNMHVNGCMVQVDDAYKKYLDAKLKTILAAQAKAEGLREAYNLVYQAEVTTQPEKTLVAKFMKKLNEMMYAEKEKL